MPNAVDEALKRANDAKRGEIEKTIDNAQRDIDSAKMQMGNSPSGDLAAIISQNEQVIAEAKRSIPAETMESVDSISSPMNTPPMHGNVNPEPVSLNPAFQSNIESIEQGGGNNYMNQNAVDKAMARPIQEPPQYDQQQTQER